jgi:RNA polymerase sigma factor (sigma-70 family)
VRVAHGWPLGMKVYRTMTTLDSSFENGLLACRDALYRAALHKFGNSDDAKDAVQETLLRAIERRNQFTGDYLPRWLQRILTNVFRDQKRKAKRLTFTADTSYANHLVDQSDPQARLEACQAFAAIAKRSDADILVQAGLGASNDNIAAQFNLSPTNVRQIISRGRKAIKEMAA